MRGREADLADWRLRIRAHAARTNERTRGLAPTAGAPDDAIEVLARSILEEGIDADPDARSFLFAFLQEDPIFFGSGHLKQKLFRRIKRMTLTEDERRIVVDLLRRRIEEGGRPEFRDLCRVIPHVAGDDLRAIVEGGLASESRFVRSRAAFAAPYLDMPIFRSGQGTDVDAADPATGLCRC